MESTHSTHNKVSPLSHENAYVVSARTIQLSKNLIRVVLSELNGMSADYRKRFRG
jgi:hypothetical protein